LFEPGQHAIGPHRVFHPPPAVADVCGLWRRSCPRHWRRSMGFVTRHELHASTFLRPLTPRALPRFSATMDALTPVGRLFSPLGHEHRSVPQRVSLLSSSTRPTVLSPITRPSPSRHFSPSTLFLWPEGQTRRPCDRGITEGHFPPGFGSGLRAALAGSPVGLAESGSRCAMFLRSRCYGPVVHLRLLPTPCCHDAVAFNYRRVNVPPDRDFHPAVRTPSQAHERGSSDPQSGRTGSWSRGVLRGARRLPLNQQLAIYNRQPRSLREPQPNIERLTSNLERPTTAAVERSTLDVGG
jgi:hypothetical protein